MNRGPHSGRTDPALIALREQRGTLWLRPEIAGSDALSDVMSMEEVDAASLRFARFAPALSALFPDSDWDGRIRSELLDHPALDGAGLCLVKGDHALPMTGSIKARGGVHELLCFIEQIALENGLLNDDSYQALAGGHARDVFAKYSVSVASTGNLGYSIGLVARAFGLIAEIHMSYDAKQWKKDRLRALGAAVIEHRCDYSETVSRARAASAGRPRTRFVDDENSLLLLNGYATGAAELAGQLDVRGIAIGPDRPLVVYLPCGVGGAPGGLTYGLKQRFGRNVICVFVEPVASACMLLALAAPAEPPPSVYDYGCDNRTIADGLAVARASDLVLSAVGNAVDAVVAVTDSEMIDGVRAAWRDAGLRLEPSGAAGLAAFHRFRDGTTARENWPALDNAVHLFWATGGSQLPDHEFLPLIADSVLRGG